MHKHELQALVEQNMTTRQIAEHIAKSQATVKWWLKKYGLSTNHKIGGHRDHCCKHCGETDATRFYTPRKTECKPCVNKQDAQKKTQKKIDAVAHMGGKCVDCGYDRYYGALEFHHPDPTVKEDWGSFGNWGYKRILKELENCVMLCANCHRERHGNGDLYGNAGRDRTDD